MARKKRKTRKVRSRTAAPAPKKEPVPPDTAYPRVPGPWYLHLLLALSLVGATAALYRGDLDLGFFHLDDPTYVVNNPNIQGATAEHVRFVLTQPYFANYSPAHLFSYMVDHAFGGLNPEVYHFSSNLWGGLAAVGVYLLALALFGRWWVALAAALLFVVHPAHVEAVAWISSRKDLVAAAFSLPAMASYFQYRRGGPAARRWYMLSILLFVLGIAGKLSVVVIPGVLFLFDFFVEKRRGAGWVLDKLPYAAVAVFFGLRVMLSQPSTRNAFDLVIFGHSTVQNLWLLTGFGVYVLDRTKPAVESLGALAPVFAAAMPVLLLLPLAFRRWVDGRTLALWYFVLLALIPSQVLSFIHPVTDRYLFFPSAGFCILLGSLLVGGENRGWRRLGGGAVVLLALFWSRATFAYLDEWQDPRSVWFAAAQKSQDVSVYQYLGTHYQDEADRLANDLNATALAQLEWADDPRLEPLLKEWTAGKTGPQTTAFQAHLRKRAAEQYEKALEQKGSRVLPNLYFRLGKYALDTRNFEEAAQKFQQAYDESQRHTSKRVRDELAVRSHHALALTYWQEKKYSKALEWIKQAEAEQNQQGTTWVPELAQQRQRLERLSK